MSLFVYDKTRRKCKKPRGNALYEYRINTFPGASTRFLVKKKKKEIVIKTFPLTLTLKNRNNPSMNRNAVVRTNKACFNLKPI